MCDTMVALSSATASGAVLFAKNSDREPNEAQELIALPAAQHEPGSVVRCTYREIPQAVATLAVLLARPFWIWGAEMGTNEQGVTIGNEALFTRLAPDDERSVPALIGMDYVRLGLERGATARAALEVITALLGEFGQGGNCGLTRRFTYQNSYLIVDSSEAWILETVGREWAAVRVTGVGAISNLITIRREWDLASNGLVDQAIDRGWCRSRVDFDFAKCYSDPLRTTLSAAGRRRARSLTLLEARHGRLDVPDLMAVLRDHGTGSGAAYRPDRGLVGPRICMHAGAGPVRVSQSVGSLVSEISPARQTHWLTGTSAPCASVFKPVWVDTGLPDLGPAPTARRDPRSLWWRHEDFHRAAIRDLPASQSVFAAERAALETRFLAAAASATTPEDRRALTEQCFAEADAALASWTERIARQPGRPRLAPLYRRAWREYDRRAGSSVIDEARTLARQDEPSG